jgi:hypothetical protein
MNTPRTWGFRFSTSDAAVIAFASICAITLNLVEGPLWWILIVVAGHFFLFCNVFRIRRSYELIWAALFMINVSAWFVFGDFAWWKILGCQLPLTAAFIFAEMRTPRYHGIFARRVNSRLDNYLAGERL